MKKILGIFGLLAAVCTITAILNPNFLSAYNIQNTIRWSSLFAILGLGAAFVIITGGIDLSIGSLLGLVGCMVPWMLTVKQCSVPVTILVVLAVSAGAGLLHGLLITKLRLQPFVVTLCGLLFYRGFARYLTDDATQGYGQGYSGLRYLANGQPFSVPVPFLGETISIPMPFLILILLASGAGILLNFTIYGRYLKALGSNERAARYSGINTHRMVILAYVLCSLCAGLGGLLFSLDLNSVQPSGLGNFYELYAIAAAVLGGCSLRGGEGSILGVLIGATVMVVLRNAINILGIPTQLEFAIIGVVILLGVIADELIKRFAARRKAARPG